MAVPLHRVTHVVSMLLSLQRFWMCGALELIDQDAPELTCSEGLTDCQVNSVSQFSAALPDAFGSVDVTQLQLRVTLCCPQRKHCKLCLEIHITLQELDSAEDVSAESGDELDEGVLIKVGLSSPGHGELWKALKFKTHQSTEQSTHQLLLNEEVTFGASFVVIAHSTGTHLVQNITIPSLEKVCSMKLNGTVEECNVPRLRAVTDHQRNVVLLRLENTDSRPEALLWQMVWNEITGEVLEWPKDKREMVLSSDLVAPCLCFQVWRRGMARQKSCPFKNQKDALERMQHNVSVSMVETPVRGGGAGLSWNVSAPCKLEEAEVWLCKKDVVGGQCEELKGSRQRIDAGWIAARNAHWHTGEFNVSSHPLLCVQIKIEGVNTFLKPQCPFTRSRLRWNLLLLVGLLLICLAILGSCFVQGILKGYVWRWLKDDDVKGAVGGGHVLLLYPPDDNQDLAELLCHLGSSLQTLGFSVSLDLWSQAELGMLGPVPWLHSRLDQLQRQGGKVVLVLTQATWTRAEEWGARSWQRNTPKEGSKDMEEEEEKEVGRSHRTGSPCADVFSASLSCVLADYLQGRAGERFMLVQFESLPPEPPGSLRQLPQLFRGLHVYSLPSQSLGFLTELAGARQMGTVSDRRKRAGGLRMASRALAQTLSSFTAGTNVLRLAGVSQGCVGVGVEETVPLQPCLITPPSSPDTNPKVSEMDWV